MSSEALGGGEHIQGDSPRNAQRQQINLEFLNKHGARLTALPVLRTRSGLERLSASEGPRSTESDQEKLRRLLSRIRATDSTWRQWRGVKQLRLCEAVALHHHLDPEAMGMSDPDFSHYQQLSQTYFHLADSPLPWFELDLATLNAFANFGQLPVVQLCKPLGHSTVRVDEVLKFLHEDPIYDFSADAGVGDNCWELMSHINGPTRLVVAVLGAAALWRTVAEGGTYIPGVRSTYPDVDSYLRREHRIESKSKRLAICTIVRPEEIPKGRPPKTPSH
jgi:hypothetical protein